MDGGILQCKPLLVEKYGEFYGEEKLIWADGWGDGVGRPEGEEKGEKTIMLRFPCEKNGLPGIFDWDSWRKGETD